MKTTPLTLDRSTATAGHDHRFPTPPTTRRPLNRCAASHHGPSATLDLALATQTEIRSEDRWETFTLLFLSGCAAVALLGGAMRAEAWLTGWESFEGFVRALLG